MINIYYIYIFEIFKTFEYFTVNEINYIQMLCSFLLDQGLESRDVPGLLILRQHEGVRVLGVLGGRVPRHLHVQRHVIGRGRLVLGRLRVSVRVNAGQERVRPGARARSWHREAGHRVEAGPGA